MHECKNQTLINSQGFTLVELMIAILLFSVVLLGIASLATVVIKGNNISKQITTSSALAQQNLEDYVNKGYGYGIYTTGTVTKAFDTITSASGGTTLYSGYKRVSVVQNGPIVNTRTLTVTVYRKSNNSVAASFSTIIAK